MSFLLDTNVVSEVRRRKPDPGLAAWWEQVSSSRLYLSVLTVGELHRGVERVRRRSDIGQADALGEWLLRVVRQFTDRILPVEPAVAVEWGRQYQSQPIPVVDGLIAATAVVHDLTLVTGTLATWSAPACGCTTRFPAHALDSVLRYSVDEGRSTVSSPRSVHLSRSRRNGPARAFGSNHVDLGGITSPASATAMTCSLLGGCRRKPIAWWSSHQCATAALSNVPGSRLTRESDRRPPAAGKGCHLRAPRRQVKNGRRPSSGSCAAAAGTSGRRVAPTPPGRCLCHLGSGAFLEPLGSGLCGQRLEQPRRRYSGRRGNAAVMGEHS